MTTSTAARNRNPHDGSGYGVRVTFTRDRVRLVGWLGFDPPKALCSCGAESGPLRTSNAARVWLTDHSHDTDADT